MTSKAERFLMGTSCAILFLLHSNASMLAQEPANSLPFLSERSIEEQEAIISRMSGSVMLRLSQMYGLESIMGKPVITASFQEGGGHYLVTGTDAPVAVNSTSHENEPSLSVKPNAPSVVVALSHQFPTSDAIASYASLNSGNTWTKGPDLPLRYSSDWSSDPVVRWSPDGTWVYACYISIRSNSSTSDIVVSRASASTGWTWTTPVVAIPGGDWDGDGGSEFPDKCWLDVHPFASIPDAMPMVYVTCTLFDYDDDIHIVFTKSDDYGATFSTPQTLATATGISGVVLQGSRPIGGPEQDVLVSWYNSEDDGWLTGSFDIRGKFSSDFGNTFGSELTIVNDMTYELGYWLGPSEAYHRWWTGMFPSVIITNNNIAHLVVASDPVAGSGVEDGNVYYVRSRRPYTNWISPVMMNDDASGKAQGFPTITAKYTGNYVLLAAWEDHRRSTSNEIYDIFGIGSDPSLLANFRLSDESSYSDLIFLGDYMDSGCSAIQSNRKAHFIWTDRRDKVSQYDEEDDVYTDSVTW